MATSTRHDVMLHGFFPEQQEAVRNGERYQSLARARQVIVVRKDSGNSGMCTKTAHLPKDPLVSHWGRVPCSTVDTSGK